MMGHKAKNPENKHGPVSRTGRRKSRQLSSEDKNLWQHVTRKILPMASDRRTGFEDIVAGDAGAAPVQMTGAATGKSAGVGLKKQTIIPQSVAGRPPASFAALERLAEQSRDVSARQNVAGLDRNSSEKLRRGKMVIEGRADLHGMTRREAYTRLRSFLGSAHRQGKRCVLVITGKGSSHEKTDDASFMGGGRKGVLRDEVPRWLSEPDMHRLVLDFRLAQPKHGGAGALYVLLRRSRTDKYNER